MKKTIVTLAVAGAVAVGGAALAAPALAESVTPTASAPSTTTSPEATPGTDAPATELSSRQARISAALEGLVADGTLTPEQSSTVASTLAAELPRGGHHDDDHDDRDGFGRAAFGQVAAATATALGLSEDELRTELRGGASIAALAQERGVDVDTVITAITDAARTQIDQGVADGRITQAQADSMVANLTAKVTEEVNETDDDDDHDGDHHHGPLGDARTSSPTATPSSSSAPTS